MTFRELGRQHEAARLQRDQYFSRVCGLDNRAIEIQRNGIITRWSEFGGLKICTGYLQGRPQITIGLSANRQVIEFTFL